MVSLAVAVVVAERTYSGQNQALEMRGKGKDRIVVNF
jgi:hypothetical protein